MLLHPLMEAMTLFNMSSFNNFLCIVLNYRSHDLVYVKLILFLYSLLKFLFGEIALLKFVVVTSCIKLKSENLINLTNYNMYSKEVSKTI